MFVHCSVVLASNVSAWAASVPVFSGLPNEAYSIQFPLRIDNKGIRESVSHIHNNGTLSLSPRAAAIAAGDVIKIEMIYASL